MFARRCRAVLLGAASLAAATFAVSAHAGYDEGSHAFDKGNFTRALQEWRPLADQGDARSQKKLGDLYAAGQGVRQDYRTAITWYRKAADQGLTSAQISLGLVYEAGASGVARDPVMAVAWYRKAATLRDAVGERSLANMYRYGLGLAQDDVIAYALFNLSPLNQYYAQALLPRMTAKQRMRAEKLTRQLLQPGNFTLALDAAARKDVSRTK